MIQNFHYQSTMVLEMSWAKKLGQDDVLKPLRSCPKPLGHALIKSQWYTFFSQNPNLVDSKPLSLIEMNFEDQMLIVDEDWSFEMNGQPNPNWSILALMSDFWFKTLLSTSSKHTSYVIVSDAMMHMEMIWGGILGQKLGCDRCPYLSFFNLRYEDWKSSSR